MPPLVVIDGIWVGTFVENVPFKKAINACKAHFSSALQCKQASVSDPLSCAISAPFSNPSSPFIRLPVHENMPNIVNSTPRETLEQDVSVYEFYCSCSNLE